VDAEFRDSCYQVATKGNVMPSASDISGKSLKICAAAFAMVTAFASAPALGGETVLHTFKSNSLACPEGCGTVFELAPDGTETVLHVFTGGCDGAIPFAALLADKAGNLYGTTQSGGNCKNSGYGTVFRLAPDGTETILYAFKGGKDGISPSGNLAMDEKGDVYGTTAVGGRCNAGGCGTVFEVTPNGRKKTLHEFQGGAGDGAVPLASAILLDEAGNLYGTTAEGGSGSNCEGGCGTVFRIAPDGTESILYSFQGGADGWWPRSGVVADSAGNLYGTTVSGGSANDGTVFKLTPDGTESVLYSFKAGKGGAGPEAGLILDSAGNLYGTADNGGSKACDGIGCGVVYTVAPDGTETILYTFAKLKDGQSPVAGLLMGQANILYGTTSGGGLRAGVVFSVTPQ
jgi:uncharacterized repeat protein (TIGR03803 family)